jgi:hypothetical protein
MASMVAALVLPDRRSARARRVPARCLVPELDLARRRLSIAGEPVACPIVT